MSHQQERMIPPCRCQKSKKWLQQCCGKNAALEAQLSAARQKRRHEVAVVEKGFIPSFAKIPREEDNATAPWLGPAWLDAVRAYETNVLAKRISLEIPW
jgi:hypothetical protein